MLFHTLRKFCNPNLEKLIMMKLDSTTFILTHTLNSSQAHNKCSIKCQFSFLL